MEEIKNPNYGYLASNTNDYIDYKVKYEGNFTDSNGETYMMVNNTVTVTAKNHQEYVRLEGFVWEEIATSKNNFTNSLYNNTDTLVEGIKVYLFKGVNQIATATTDSNGWYQFGTKKANGQEYTNSDYFNESNGNLKIDELDEYRIEFEYDGLRFTSVLDDSSYTSSNYEKTSKAKEVESIRREINADFSEITNGYSRKRGTTKYKLEYNYANHVSTYIDHWGYQYNGNRLKVTPSTDYVIIASINESGFSIKSAYKAQFEKKGAESISGINLGIQRREQSDLAIASDLTKVNIIVKNYENEYTYGKRDLNSDLNLGAQVKFGNSYGTGYSDRGLNTYTRRIYESDLVLNEKEPGIMQVYVTYKITVKNQSNSLTSIVNELTNYYDSRYDIEDSWIENGGTTKQIGASSWTNVSEYGVGYSGNGYTAGYTNETAHIMIGPNEKYEVYIKFKLKPEAIKALIEKQTTLNNVTEISSFSTVTLTNSSWAPYASIDEDSNPGSVQSLVIGVGNTQTTLNGRKYEIETKTVNQDKFEDDTDSAPSLVLGIEEDGPTRGLSGTVFVDKESLHQDDGVHPGEERLGDGILHAGGDYKGKGKYGKIDTDRVQNVKVELIEYDNNATDHIARDFSGNPKIATAYKLSVNNGIRTAQTENAVAYTDEKGNYTIVGVIPGKYLIRYTYGKGSYIVDSNGNRIEEVNANDYKSTIITSDIIKNALNLGATGNNQNERIGDLNWILTYDGIPDNGARDERSKSNNLAELIRYSGAIDEVTKREKTDNINYGSYEGITLMTANSAFFNVGVEYNQVYDNGFSNKITYTDYSDEYKLEGNKIVVLDRDGRIKIVDTFYAVNPYQDFGIIERAIQDYEINKRISSLKVTLANGQILINGSPYKQVPENYTNIDEYWNNLETVPDNPLPYLKALPGQIITEIDNEIIQGAVLNIEYTITIKNKSEKDYRYDESTDYYYYGKNPDKELNTVIRKIVDYMDDSIEYDDKQNEKYGWVRVTADELFRWTKDEEDNNKRLIDEDVRDAVNEDYVIAITEYFNQECNTIDVGKVGNVKIYGSKVLSSAEGGTNVRNHVEIIEIKGIRAIKGSKPGNYNPTTCSPNEPDDDVTKLVITPPTGATNNKIIIAEALGILLIACVCGIYFIKKKILY